MEEQDSPKDPLRALTLAGCLLLFATLLGAGGVFCWFVLHVNDQMPGESYSLAFLLIPAIIGAAAFFLVASILLRLMGIRVWKSQGTQDDHRR